MDPTRADKALEPGLSPELENQKKMINQLASLVQNQNTRLNQLTQNIESALSTAHEERNALKATTLGTSSALSNIGEKLDALMQTITPNPVLNPPPEPIQPSSFDQNMPLPPRPVPLEPNLANPRGFDGDLSLCRGFLEQCEMMFRHQTTRYPSDESKVAQIVSLLSGRALEWAVASLKKTPLFYANYSAFVTELRLVFDHPPVAFDPESRLHKITQGSRSVAEYSVE